MGASAMNMPAPPPGFELIQDTSGSMPPPPPGFELMSVDAAFRNVQAQPEAPGLRGGLERRAAAMKNAPPASMGTRMATEFLNQGAAAGQLTTPDIASQERNLLSSEVHQNEVGELLFRDPRNGQMVVTDQNKHVVLRDPADQKVKVFARTENTNEGQIASAGRMLMTGLASGAPTARPGLATSSVAITPRASEIMATSKPHYQAFKAEAANIDVPAETAAGIGDRIRSALTRANLIPELAQPVYSAVGILDKGETTLDALQNVKRVIGRGFNSPDKNVRDAAAVASREIGKVISEVSPTAGKSLRTADEIHSTALSVQDLQRKASVADLRAGRAGYGGNAVNSMRQVLSPIVQRATEGRLTGFKPNEIEAMREIVEGTAATNLARGIGQLSPSKGVLQTMLAAGGTVAAGPAALAIPALGAASNKLATILTGKQIERMQELVAKRSPAYAEAVAKAISKYERAQTEFLSDPSPARFAAYLSASRALSSGLTRDGVAKTSGDLLRAIQGPVRVPAQEEQQ